jgi:hypothetical protein
MPRQPDLFPAAPRRPRRVLMRVVDAGDHGCITDKRWFVHLVCQRCGHDAEWLEFSTKRESLSQPCPKCNGGGDGA